MRIAYQCLALAMLALAFIGAFTPGLPSTVFVLIAAWAAARGNPKLHQWLLNHKLFGPTLRAWESNRSIPRRAKCLAYACLIVVAAVGTFLFPAWVLWLYLPTLFLVVMMITWFPTAETTPAKKQTA
jgi:uncharacterized protein